MLVGLRICSGVHYQCASVFLALFAEKFLSWRTFSCVRRQLNFAAFFHFLPVVSTLFCGDSSTGLIDFFFSVRLTLALSVLPIG